MRRLALLLAWSCVTIASAFEDPSSATATSNPAVKAPTSPTDSSFSSVSQHSAASPSASNSWKALLLPREELPDGRNALVRWRPLFEKLQPDTVETSQLLQGLTSPIEDVPAIDDPILRKWLSDIAPLVKNDLILRDREAFQLPVLRGPETPFPDHAPLLRLATVRVALMKAAWLDGHSDEALALAIDNLRLSRSFLGAQEALIALIEAAGTWQISLDGVYWLARQESLTPEMAARLQNELLADERLASTALIRGFRSEFTFFTRLVIDRLPKTKDVNLLLAGIATLGMSSPEPIDPKELQLAIPERDPFDREATLQLSADDISGWISAFGKNRHPGGLTSRHTGPQLQAYAKEIAPLLRYATAEVEPTPARILEINQLLASVKNPVGKLFLIITTSQWEPLSLHLFRREAERSALVGLLAQRRVPAEPFASVLPLSAAIKTDSTLSDPTSHTAAPAQVSTLTAFASPTALTAPTAPAALVPPAAATTASASAAASPEVTTAAPSAPKKPVKPAAAPSPSSASDFQAASAPVSSSAPTAVPVSVTPTAPRFQTWEKLVAAKLLPAAPADPFTTDAALHLDVDPLQPRIWSVGENGIDDGGQGSGENVGRPLDLTWPISLLTRSTAPADGI